ncbi:MAG: DUF4339 domain-containing protein [Bauldia litoralis]|uniref:DUF4339 domain-containing protein n=4 Tax=Hyphomicrobiales TaxID=356 RepID=UPI0032969FB0
MRIAGPVLLFILTLLWGSAASADHMSGTYQGTGDVAGVTLELRQNGNSLQGTISGSDQGTLTGQTDGGNNAQGEIQLAQPGIAPIKFQGVWSQNGLAMRLQFTDGTRDVFFQAGGSGPAPGPTPPGPGPTPPGPGPTPPGPPPLPQTDVEYFVAVNGQPVGPLPLQEMIQRIQQGSIARTDLVWKTGAPGWAPAESYPELAAAFAGGPPPLPPGGGGGTGGGGTGGGGTGGGGKTPGGGGSGGGSGGGGLTPPSG